MSRETEDMSDDVIMNPHKYGMPTFAEFARDPEKYLGRPDEVLALADEGCSILRKGKALRRHQYEIEGYKCKTIEEVQKVAAQQGIPLETLDYRPQVLPQGCGKFDILVRFVPKDQIEERQNKEVRAGAIKRLAEK